MSQHPANLILRFFLEIVGLYAFGQWGWRQAGDPWRWVLAIGLPLLAAAVWATFKVKDDQEVSGKVIVPVSGRLRLGIESIFFGLAIAALLSVGQLLLAGMVLFAISLHYLLSMDRLRRLAQK
jgi:hypothetical protein